MDNLFHDSLVLMGICFILKYATILDFIREPLQNFHPKLKELFNCCLCMGFWIGLLFGICSTQYSLLFSFYSSTVCWVGDYVIQIIQKHLYDE